MSTPHLTVFGAALRRAANNARLRRASRSEGCRTSTTRGMVQLGVNLPTTEIDSSTITAVAPSLGDPAGHGRIPEPRLSVEANGLGSMLYCWVPPGSYVLATPGTTVGRSACLQPSWSTLGHLGTAFTRKVAGGAFVLDSYTAPDDAAGDILIGPDGLGDIMTIAMNGDETISVSAKSLLCVTPHIRVSSGQFLSNLIPGWSGLRPLDVIGKGTIAITSYGGLFKLVLSKDERYIVSSRHLVAWDSKLDPRDPDDVQPSTDPLERALNLWKRTKRYFSVLRKTEMYELSGPGDFYLSSRVEPSFSYLRSSVAQKPVQEYMTVRVADGIDKAAVSPDDASAAQLAAMLKQGSKGGSGSASWGSSAGSASPPTPAADANVQPAAFDDAETRRAEAEARAQQQRQAADAARANAQAQAKQEAEAAARAEAERKAKQTEAERKAEAEVRAKQEAAERAAQAEKEAAEKVARAEAEARAKEEAAEQAAAKAKADKEQREMDAKRIKEEVARKEAEAAERRAAKAAVEAASKAAEAAAALKNSYWAQPMAKLRFGGKR